MKNENSTKHVDLLSKMEQDSFHDFSTFIRDGIIDESSWEKAPIKILYLLKEAYTKGNPKFDLTYDLKNSDVYYNWKRVAQWVYAFEYIYETKTKPEYIRLSEPQSKEFLCKIAVVNLKKSRGKTSSNKKDLSMYVQHDKNNLREQIDIVNPDIVICANIFNYYKKIYSGDEIENIKENLKVYKHRNRFIIDFWHFSNRKGVKFVFNELAETIIKSGIFK